MLLHKSDYCIGSHDHDRDEERNHYDAPSVYEVPPGYATQQHPSSSVPSWTNGYGDEDDDNDDYGQPPVSGYSKPPIPACSPTTLYETKTVPTTIHYANTVETTLSVTGPSGPTVYVTSLTSKPAVTVYITTTVVETNVYPIPTTVTSTKKPTATTFQILTASQQPRSQQLHSAPSARLTYMPQHCASLPHT